MRNLDALSPTPVRPMHDYVLRVTLMQSSPFLIAKDVEVRVIKFCEASIGKAHIKV